MTPRALRCTACRVSFAIMSGLPEKKHPACPACRKTTSVEDIDITSEVGGAVARRVFEWFKNLPSED